MGVNIIAKHVSFSTGLREAFGADSSNQRMHDLPSWAAKRCLLLFWDTLRTQIYRSENKEIIFSYLFVIIRDLSTVWCSKPVFNSLLSFTYT